MEHRSALEQVPVIDIFAGPGGLGEGFACLRVTKRKQACFRIALSIEKDKWAHSTLQLRAFFRQFADGDVPQEYYQYLRREIDRERLFSAFAPQAKAATDQAWRAELGAPDVTQTRVDKRIRDALGGRVWWVLVGGPPCQAYSVIGRSRMRRKDPAKFEKDPRHLLYKEYLRILAEHKPPVFVMENVPGLLSSMVDGNRIFDQMLEDLRNPCRALYAESARACRCDAGDSYEIYSLVKKRAGECFWGDLKPRDYIIKSEWYGVPQTRHRVILLGVRRHLAAEPRILRRRDEMAPMWGAIYDLPPIRSILSREKDSGEAWQRVIQAVKDAEWVTDPCISGKLRQKIVATASSAKGALTTGGEFVPRDGPAGPARKWYRDTGVGGYCNHAARRHMRSDLARYLFAACFAELEGRTPKLRDYPPALLPDHRNVGDALTGGYFNDRFRVQVRSQPATTIVSHICKDGHYYIHPDPEQCRTLTVREVARLQTFPDSYFFEGPRTAQYVQVGNAVPPVLARQIAKVVYDLVKQLGALD